MYDDTTALRASQAERAEWEALLAQVGEERMDTPGVEGQGSVKDIVAHLTWYDRTFVEGAQTVMRGESFVRTGLRALGMDERNERIAAESRYRPLRDVLAASRQVFAQVLGVVRACPDDVLNDGRLVGLPDDVPPRRPPGRWSAHHSHHGDLHGQPRRPLRPQRASGVGRRPGAPTVRVTREPCGGATARAPSPSRRQALSSRPSASSSPQGPQLASGHQC